VKSLLNLLINRKDFLLKRFREQSCRRRDDKEEGKGSPRGTGGAKEGGTRREGEISF
jgi:hypothetical protein